MTLQALSPSAFLITVRETKGLKAGLVTSGGLPTTQHIRRHPHIRGAAASPHHVATGGRRGGRRVGSRLPQQSDHVAK